MKLSRGLGLGVGPSNCPNKPLFVTAAPQLINSMDY